MITDVSKDTCLPGVGAIMELIRKEKVKRAVSIARHYLLIQGTPVPKNNLKLSVHVDSTKAHYRHYL